MTCLGCDGRGISYGRRCVLCDGTGKVDGLPKSGPVLCEYCDELVDPYAKFSSHLHRLAEITSLNHKAHTFTVIKCPRRAEREIKRW